MNNKLNKAEILAAARKVLHDLASWTALVFDNDAMSRLADCEPMPEADWEQDWQKPLSAGSTIEQSIAIAQLSRVVEFLNTNVWHGDPSALRSASLKLSALRELVSNPDAIVTEFEDFAIDQKAAIRIKEVLDSFLARELLENDDSIDISHLALVSGFAEKTVRMAAVGRGDNPDLVTYKDGNRTRIAQEDAIQWMKKKNVDYAPIAYSDTGTLPPVDPTNLYELGQCLKQYREALGLGLQDMTGRLGWSNELLAAYTGLESSSDKIDLSPFDLNVVVQLAETLCPAETGEFAKIIDKVIHPYMLEAQIEKQRGIFHQGGN